MSEDNSSSSGGGCGCLLFIIISTIVGLLLFSYGFDWQQAVGFGLLAGLGAAAIPTLLCVGFFVLLVAIALIYAYSIRRKMG